jgi:hypothetical protein
MARQLSEADRKRYFRNFYPADLLSTFFGPGRCGASQGPRPPNELRAPVWQLDAGDLASAPALAAQMRAAKGHYSVHIDGAIVAKVKNSDECEAVLTAHEVGLDVDLDAYGDRRSLLCGCAQRKAVCDACWLLAEMAAAVCEAIVTGACKLGPMLCVASGGKGIHMWWGAPQARRLSLAKRKALVAILTDTSAKSPVHEAAVTALMDVWVKRGIVQRAILADATCALACALADEVAAAGGPPFAWPECRPPLLPGACSKRRWEALVARLGSTWVRGFVILIGWPILDTGVTLTRGHLLKTPFSIHHTSQRIALPLPSVRACLPSQLPTAEQVMDPGCKEAKKRWDAGRATLEAWLVACQYGPQYEFYNV